MAIQQSQFEQEYDKEDAMYTFQEAIWAIQLWKSHQLQHLNQDAARTECIDCLKDDSVLLIRDWAMKFLPRHYQKSQGEWFAKKGFSWHTNVPIRKRDSEMETQAFLHIVVQCNQDSPCVVMLMEHVLATLKKENPNINRAFYHQDNTGCYHAAYTILACKEASKRTGIYVQRLDFSDPQGGKGPWDRFAATMKNHVRAFIDEGNDVSTTAQFEKALMSHGEVSGVRVSLIQGSFWQAHS